MLRDNLVELIEPMLNSAGADPLALYIHNRTQASDDRLPCLKNPRPEGAEPSLTESSSSPFQAEPAHNTRVHFIQPLKERIVREVGYGLSLERASSAALVKTMQAKSEPVARKGKSA